MGQGKARAWKSLAVAAAAMALLAPQSAQAFKAHYMARLSGAESYTGFEHYLGDDGGPTCRIYDTEKYKFGATFETPDAVPIVVTNPHGDISISPPLHVEVKQHGLDQTHYDHQGSPQCGQDEDGKPTECEKTTHATLPLWEETEVVGAPNTVDTFRTEPNRLTVALYGTRHTCFNPLLFGDDYVPRPFFPGTTGDEKAEKLLSPNTKHITLRAKRHMLESGNTKIVEGTWHAGWSTKWALHLVRVKG